MSVSKYGSLATQTLRSLPKHKCSATGIEHNGIFNLLASCGQTSDVSQLHAYSMKAGLDCLSFPLSKLLAAASIQDVQYAATLFNNIQNPSLFMFNTMLRAYSSSDYPIQAFWVFNKLRSQLCSLDQFSFIPTLKACARLLATGFGEGLHGIALRYGHLIFINVKNTLLNFYCACKRVSDAHKLFDEFPPKNDIVSWNTLMGGYLHVCRPTLVFDLFRQMSGNGMEATFVTTLSLISAVSDMGNHIAASSIHGHCVKLGFCSDVNVATALIDMYAETGRLDSARGVFDGVAMKDVVSWNCLIDKYANYGLVEEALSLLHLMKQNGLKPISSTLVGLISACAASGTIHICRSINNYVEDEELQLDAVLGTALVDMYMKCGFLDKAVNIFYRMEIYDVQAWTAMISGYGAHGKAVDAIKLFYKMEEEGFIPNEITFLATLNACSHGGLVVEGMTCFERMVTKYGYLPRVEHYGCIIDLLGRAGMLEEAHKLITSLPIRGDATAWRTLLAACRNYGNAELGTHVKDLLTKIYEDHPADSLLISSTYAAAGSLPGYAATWEMNEDDKRMKDTCRPVDLENKISKKEIGMSSIEIESEELECSLFKA